MNKSINKTLPAYVTVPIYVTTAYVTNIYIWEQMIEISYLEGKEKQQLCSLQSMF